MAESSTATSSSNGPDTTTSTFVPLDEQVIASIAARIQTQQQLASPKLAVQTVEEVGDGNLNYIFHVTLGNNDKKRQDLHEPPQVAWCVKQAPPFIKVVPAFGLPQSRASFETEYLKICNVAACTSLRLSSSNSTVVRFVPRVIDDDEVESQGYFVMEWLDNHTVLREFLNSKDFECVSRQRSDGKAVMNYIPETMGDYFAAMMFASSSLTLDTDAKRDLEAKFVGNHMLCKLTAEVRRNMYVLG